MLNFRKFIMLNDIILLSVSNSYLVEKTKGEVMVSKMHFGTLKCQVVKNVSLICTFTVVSLLHIYVRFLCI